MINIKDVCDYVEKVKSVRTISAIIVQKLENKVQLPINFVEFKQDIDFMIRMLNALKTY